jgi:TatA/E family protein of Tat protein translocase
MIGSLGVPELLFILVLALLVFGPRKLPEIGRTLGRALGEFRRATSDLKRTLDVELSTEESRGPAAAPQIVPPPQQPPADPAPAESPEPSGPTDVAEPSSNADDVKAPQDAE